MGGDGGHPGVRPPSCEGGTPGRLKEQKQQVKDRLRGCAERVCWLAYEAQAMMPRGGSFYGTCAVSGGLLAGGGGEQEECFRSRPVMVDLLPFESHMLPGTDCQTNIRDYF